MFFLKVKTLFGRSPQPKAAKALGPYIVADNERARAEYVLTA
jgi:hypothetical protein